MRAGWICLHRKLEDNPRFKDSAFVHIWIYFLMKSTHAPLKVMFKGDVIELKPGQFITGRKAISEATGINESKVRRVIKTLEIDQQIDHQKSNLNSLVSILNWDQYQTSDQPNGQPVTNQRPTSDHIQQHNNETTEQLVLGVGANGSHPTTTESDWLEVIGKSEAYAGIDTKREFSKLEQWCKINRQKPTKRRFLAWLNRIEAPIKAAEIDYSKGW